MPLADHLRELRNRLAKAVLAIVVVTIVAAFFSEQLMQFLLHPVPKCAAGLDTSNGGNCAVVTFNTLTSPFTTVVRVSLMVGVLVASPVWLYQLWAFIAPGLHKHERKYTYYFVSVAVPLFLGGAYLAYVVLPISVQVLLSLTPSGSSNILGLDDVLDFTTRMVLIFGLAFELPLLLAMMNITGLVSGRRMVGWWRGVVMGIFVFGAVATPTTDPVGMIALAGPIVLLYFGAVGFALLNDRRRAARVAAGPADDEASELDLDPEEIGEVESVPAPRALPEGDGAARGGYDDAT